MDLAKPDRFGPYEIVAPLGAGGMGEVYRARDTRLNRDVALKVMRGDATENAGLRARFATDARAVAALNHPNIVAIFDFGEEDGVQYAVSELIEGESLRALLRKGPVGVRKLIDIAAQIADGLSAAHAAQIAHRDLKPENIMLTSDGRVKILDFGLARQTSAAAAASSADPATLTIQTPVGTVLGTPNYMSPEQARGLAADYRSDQFSFGLILYELATGKKAFERGSTVETLAAIVREEPAPMETKLPPPLRWAMERCLAKDAPQRYDSTRDLYQDLRSLRDHLSEALTGVSAETVRSPARPAYGLRTVPTWVAAALAVALAGAIFVGLRLSRGEDISRYRYTPYAMNSAARPSRPSWSPDGRAIAWTEMVDEQNQVFVRYLNSAVPTQITHQTAGATGVRWSADGKRVIFYAKDHALYSIAVVGGEPELLAAVPISVVRAQDVSPDGRALAVLGRKEGGKYQVWISSPAGSPFREYAPAPFASSAGYNISTIRFSPDGKKILLIHTGDSDSEEAWLLPFPAGVPRRVFTGLPTQRIQRNVSWMPDNRHVAMAAAYMDSSIRSHIWILDTESNDAVQITNGTGDQFWLDVSPDGRRLAYTEVKRDYDIVNVSLIDGAASRFIATDVSERMPGWSRGSPKMVYATDRSGTIEIWLRTSDGQDRPLVTAQSFSDGGTRYFMNPALSPDGETVAFSRMNDKGEMRTWIMPLATGVPQRLNEAGNGVERLADWSADGKRIIELSVTGGRNNLMIVKVGSREAPFLLRDRFLNSLPAWSPAGEWITYHDLSGWYLISPDGKTTRSLGNIATPYLMFSRDGKLLYGIRGEGVRQTLFSLDIATGATHDIRDLGKEFAPASDYMPGIRFTLTPDGKSMTYAVQTYTSDIWLLDGLRQPRNPGFSLFF